MAKKVIAQIKLQIPAGQATPAPPVGPALGQHGVNIMEFVKAFNEKTKGREGLLLPAGQVLPAMLPLIMRGMTTLRILVLFLHATLMLPAYHPYC